MHTCAADRGDVAIDIYLKNSGDPLRHIRVRRA